jgi:predicted phage terminase large subunit-like protein
LSIIGRTGDGGDIQKLSRASIVAVRKRLAEDSLYEFVKQAWHVVEPSTDFVEGWHLEAVCSHLEACTRGDIRKLIINIPPRHMKSLAVNVFWFAWTWIHDPASRWMCSSYSSALAVRDNVKARSIVESPWYQRNWGRRVSLNPDQNTKDRFDNLSTGFRLATSVGGKATGEGGDYIVIDDPHKADDMRSEAGRAAVLNWWDNTMSTRVNDPKTGRHVVVMQRLHEADLAGYLIEQNRGYDILCIPCEYDRVHPIQTTTSIGWEDPRQEDGELIWPERYGRKEVDELKLALGNPYNISGQLQQRPAPTEGGMFEKGHFQYYRLVKAGEEGNKVDVFQFTDDSGNKRTIFKDACFCFQVCDTALKTKDDNNYTVVMTVYVGPQGQIFIHDVLRERIPVPKQYGHLVTQRLRYPEAQFQAVEEQASGIGLLQEGRAKGTPFRPLKAKGDKVQRATVICTAYENRMVFHRSPDQAQWLEEFENEILFFPNSRHDDQVDCLSYAGMLSLNRALTSVSGPLILNATDTPESEKFSDDDENGLSPVEKVKRYMESARRHRIDDDGW